MRSKVTKPYDYKLIPVPREMRLWRITDQELEEHLETLSHNHAYEADVDMVELGDSVACRGESAAARWNRPVLLFYPGRGICDEALENACVGAKLGERRTVTVEGDEITLTVTRIVRRSRGGERDCGENGGRRRGKRGMERCLHGRDPFHLRVTVRWARCAFSDGQCSSS